MSDYPYETRLDIAFQPLELIDIHSLAQQCQF